MESKYDAETTWSERDLSSQELQVTQLIKQNKNLTSTIIQNNEVIASNANQLLEYTNRITKMKEELSSLKVKLRTLEDEVASLKVENAKLKETTQTSNHRNTKNLLMETTDRTLRDFELERANKKIKELEALLESLKINESEDGGKVFEDALRRNEENHKEKLKVAKVTILQLKRKLQEVEEKKNEELTANRRLMEEKLEGYKRELEESDKRISWLEEQVKIKGELNVDEFEALKQKLLLSELDLDRKQNENATLESQLAEAMRAAGKASELQIELKNILKERDHLASDLHAKDVEIFNIKTKLESKEQQLLLANLNAKDDMQKVLDREEQLKVENSKAKGRIVELEQQLELVQENLEVKAQQSHAAEIAQIGQQFLQSEIALSDAMQKKAVAEGQLQDANREVESLAKQLERNKDDLLALQAQVEAFRSDFNVKHQSLQEEKDRNKKMSEELQQIQNNNKILQEEVELLRIQLYQGPGECCQIPRPQYTCYSDSSQASNCCGAYICPKCHFASNNLHEAETHIDRCLN